MAKHHGAPARRKGPLSRKSFGSASALTIRSDWSCTRVWIGKLIHNKRADLALALTTVLNLFVVIMQTDRQAAGDDDVSSWMLIVNVSTLSLFTLESACRIYVHRVEIFFHPFYVLDIVVCVVDVVVVLLSDMIDFIPMLSLLRVWRIVRLMDALARLDEFRELYLMISGLRAAVKSILWATMMIGASLVFASVFAVQIIHPLNKKVAERGTYGDCARCPKAFASVWDSCLTFIQQIITGDSWGMVTLPIIESYPLSALFFLPVFLLIDMAIVNLVLMVVVDQAEEARADDLAHMLADKEAAMVEAKAALRDLCGEMDSDLSGYLSLQELKTGAEKNEEFSTTLRLMDIDAEEMETVFAIMDDDESGTVSYDEFCDQLFKMKTDNAHSMIVFMRHQLKKVTSDVQKLMAGTIEELRLTKEGLNILQTEVKSQLHRNQRTLEAIAGSLGVKEPQSFGQEAVTSQTITEGKTSKLPNKFKSFATHTHETNDPLNGQLTDGNRLASELSQLQQWISQELTPILHDEIVPVLHEVKVKLDASWNSGGLGAESKFLSQRSSPWMCGGYRMPQIMRVNAGAADDTSGLQNVSNAKNTGQSLELASAATGSVGSPRHQESMQRRCEHEADNIGVQPNA